MSRLQNRVYQIVGIVLCVGVCVLLNAGESQAGIGGLLKNQVNKAKDKVKSEIEEKVGTARETDEEKPPQDANPETAETTPEASAGSIVFSASPIDVENPTDLTSSFTAGQTIYSLITVEKPWKEIYAESSDSDKTEIGTVMFIDGKRYFQYITLTGEMMDATHLLLDIAPKLAEMTAYRDPEVSFPNSMGSKWGPGVFTDKFSQLEAGEHTVEYQVSLIRRSVIIAKGSFTVSGEDFSAYADLHSQIQQELDAQRGFPAAQMTDKNMENTMLSLCQNSELTDVKKLHIISKDWWYERVAGGDSAYKARYLETAVAAQDGDGCYYSIVTFHQDALLGGGWGSLYLSHIGTQKRLPCENIQE